MKKAIDYLQKIETVCGAVALTIFLVAVIFQMLARYLGITALWTEDVSMYSFIIAVFLGAAVMIRDKRHFAFTALADKITDERKKAALSILINFILIFFCAFMFYYGVKITQKFWNYKWVSIPAFKRGPTWMCVPISAGTMIIYLVEDIVNQFKTLGKGGKA